MTTKRVTAVLAALGAALTTLLLFATGASAATYPPSSSSSADGVHVTNPHPHAGGTIVVQGNGCQPGSTVTVSLDGKVIGSGKVNAHGKYSIPVKIPANTPPGEHTISVSGGNCPGSGVLGIEVLAPGGGGGGGGNLAGTGVAVVGIGALGVVLLVGGGLMLLAGRRRASNHA